jgi:ABC-2 type transport system permease protein
MHEIWLVFRREFLERIRARTFLIGTLVFPLFMGGVMFLPSMLDRGEDRSIVVVDESGFGVGNALAERLTREPEDESANRYTVQVIEEPLASHQADLTARVENEQIDGYLVIPPELLETNTIRYRSTSIASPGMMRDLQVAASESVRGERLRHAGIDFGTISAVIRPVTIDDARVSGTGEEQGDAATTFILAYILSFVIYFMVFFYGVNVMRSVLEEKTSRIAEVLVSSLHSSNLMAGKILGVAGAAFLQVLIWATLLGLMVSQSEQIANRMGIDPETLGSVRIKPAVGLLLLTYFLLGFFLYASLFAALGAAVNSDQEAQSFQMVLIVPLVVPLLFLIPLTSEPLGTAATFLGMFPFSAPVAMPMRLSAAPIPPLQIALSIGILILTLLAVGWLAGKIYRIGILATGQRPSLRDLAQWLRMS